MGQDNFQSDPETLITECVCVHAFIGYPALVLLFLTLPPLEHHH